MKRIVALLVVVGVLAATAAVTYAVDKTATVTITGGTLSVTPTNVTLSGVTLDGTDKTATSAFGGNAWKAEDATGTGLGWNVTIEATDFSDGASHTIDISEADQEFKIQIETANITVIQGQDTPNLPTSSVTSLTAIPTAGGTPLKIVFAAANKGMGEYNIPPAFELEVRAETVAGVYNSTITVAINTGP
jgi:hypothetical protein